MKQPMFRFKGFTGDWEQGKLGDIVGFSKGTGYSKADLQENGTLHQRKSDALKELKKGMLQKMFPEVSA